MSTTMANISAAQVKELREKTGAPMMDCKQALTEAKGDLEQAIVVLRKKGVSVAAKKAARVTSEGSVAPLHSRRRQDWRAGRGQLRKRFRGAHRRLQRTGPRHRHAHCGERSEVRPERRRHAGSLRARERHLSRPGDRQRQAREHRRENGRRQDGKVLRRGLPARAALHQGPDHQHLATDRRQGGQARREHRGAPFRPLQSWRRRRNGCLRHHQAGQARTRAARRLLRLPSSSRHNSGALRRPSFDLCFRV